MRSNSLRCTQLFLGLLLSCLGSCGDKGPELPPEAKPYANALRVSNAALERFQKGEIQKAYEEYLDPRLQQKLSAEQFTAPIRATLQKFGPIRQSNPAQYAFAHGQNATMKLLFSTKVVQHERATLRYQFQFEDDGKYEKIVGMSVDDGKPPPKAAPPAAQPDPGVVPAQEPK